MTTNLRNTVCTRCGKQRITLSVNEEKIGNSVIITTEKTCPDLDCQKIVDAILGEEQKKRQQALLLKQANIASKRPIKIVAS